MAGDGSAGASRRVLAEQAMRRSWFPVARSGDLAQPQAATLLGRRLVVYRGASGRPVVAERRCPHRGGDLARGSVHGDDLACPYHGWRYAGSDGRCVLLPSLADQSKIPRKARIATFPAVERFGHVWTVLEDPLGPLYDPAEWRDLNLDWLAADPIPSPTGVAVAMENFRDVAHFPFVHRVSMGLTPWVVEPLEVRREGVHVFMDRPLYAGSGDWGNQGDCLMRYHCIAPGFASITYDYDRLGKRIVAGFPSPVSYEEVVIFWGVANEVSFRGDPIEECLRVEQLVYLEDVPVVEGLEPREVPWDHEYPEVSVPADAFTLTYRLAFKELMKLTSGAAASASHHGPAAAPVP
jgi:phenylpropionate dioxygenase-like ring-hydroxylating dioxygenase large terminal subunit